MNHAEHLRVLISPELAALRKQTAVARTLLVECERATASDFLREQLVEELARLGCQLMETAAEMAKTLDARSTEAELGD